jgi:hypothetical protein
LEGKVMRRLKCPSCGLEVSAIDPMGELCLRCRIREGRFVRLQPHAVVPRRTPTDSLQSQES